MATRDLRSKSEDNDDQLPRTSSHVASQADKAEPPANPIRTNKFRAKRSETLHVIERTLAENDAKAPTQAKEEEKTHKHVQRLSASKGRPVL
jgi:hypothetical protein